MVKKEDEIEEEHIGMIADYYKIDIKSVNGLEDLMKVLNAMRQQQ